MNELTGIQTLLVNVHDNIILVVVCETNVKTGGKKPLSVIVTLTEFDGLDCIVLLIEVT